MTATWENTRRPMPANEEAERAALGCLVLDNRLWTNFRERVPSELVELAIEEFDTGKIVNESLFSCPANELIFGAIASMIRTGRAVDLTTLAAKLADHQQLERVGGAVFLASLEEDIFAPGQVGEYARIIMEKWSARDLIRRSQQVAQLFAEGKIERAQNAVDELQGALERVSADRDQPDSNTALRVMDFFAVPREPLRYFIEGVLPERGKLTISAQAKGFKTTLLIELGLCAAAGGVDYLNFRFGAGVPVLLVQPELSDGLLSERLGWISRTAPEWLDSAQAQRNFHVLQTDHGRPALWHEHPRAKQSRAEVERAIERSGAKILLVDSLYMSFAGMDENDAAAMTLALDYLGALTVSHDVAIILVHHFNKSGTAARGSSVFQGWGETDLTVSAVPDEPVVKVEALMRCAFPKGFPAYWQRPDESTAWFELLPDYEPRRGKGGRPPFPNTIVALALKAAGGSMAWSSLRDQVAEAAGCGKRKAADLISSALSAGLVSKIAGVYSVVKQGE